MPACLQTSSRHKKRYWQIVVLVIAVNYRCLRLPYSEYFCATIRTVTPSCWPAILKHNLARISYLHFFPTFHTISCRHRALLLISLHLYCYYKKQTLSIPLGHLKQRFQIFNYLSRLDKNQNLFRVLLRGYMRYDD